MKENSLSTAAISSQVIIARVDCLPFACINDSLIHTDCYIIVVTYFPRAFTQCKQIIMSIFIRSSGPADACEIKFVENKKHIEPEPLLHSSESFAHCLYVYCTDFLQSASSSSTFLPL